MGFLRDRLGAGVQTTLGVHVGDVLEARVADDDRVTVRLVVREGKHRMVRRMLANVGAPVVGLRRERFGDVLLGELAEGACEALADEAVPVLARAAFQLDALERDDERRQLLHLWERVSELN